MLGALNNSMVEQGMDVGGAASKAGKIIRGQLDLQRQGTRAFKQDRPRAVGLGSFEQAEKPRTNVPVVNHGGVSVPRNTTSNKGKRPFHCQMNR